LVSERRASKVFSRLRIWLPVAPNLLERDFHPSAPDRVWSRDITYIATDEGWLFLAAVIDLFSRQVGKRVLDTILTRSVSQMSRT
jgi:putative transposase